VAKIGIHNLEGKEVEKIELDSSVFEVQPKNDLIAQVYHAICANSRKAIAHTKNRSARAGSTRKPWKQKGTGRARTGSVRNPIWRKGGVIFGPTNERNFSQKINKKVKSQVMRMVLSGKLKDGELVVVDSYEMEESKTKKMAQALKKLKIEKSALMTFGLEDAASRRAARNIAFVDTVSVNSLNIVDALHHKFIVLSKDGVESLTKQYMTENMTEKKNVTEKKTVTKKAEKKSK
jgi:large subunit ribosomal protein L4